MAESKQDLENTIDTVLSMAEHAEAVADKQRKNTEARVKKRNQTASLGTMHIDVPVNLDPIAKYLHRHGEPLKKFGIISKTEVQLRLAKYIRHYMLRYTKYWYIDNLDRASNVMKQAEAVAYTGIGCLYYKFRINPSTSQPPMTMIAYELINHLNHIERNIRQNK